MKRRKAEKLLLAGQLANTPMEGVPDGGGHIPLDDIPDAPQRKKYTKKVKYDMGHVVTREEWLFLQMAKMMLQRVK
jgi:hypothetical protein